MRYTAALSAAVVLGAALCTQGALAQNSIRIGVVGPMSLMQGEAHWDGARLAADEINSAGGISAGGKKLRVELIRVDSNETNSVPDATNAMERVITRDKADFVIGGFRSEAVIAMQEVAMDHKKIFLGTGASTSKLGLNVEQNYERYKYWFRITPNKDTDLARTVFTILASVAAQIRKELGTETPKVALLAEKAMWTEPLIAAAQKSIPTMKMELVGVWQPSANATDVTAELSAIERTGAPIVFTVLSGPVGIVVGRQMGERSMKAVAFGINVEGQKDEFWKATGGKANYVATLDTFAEVEMTPRTIPFVRAFKARYNKMPTYNAGTYDAILLLKEAIEKSGTTAADALVPVIEKMTYVAAGGVIEFDKRHDQVWGVGKLTGMGVQWQDGEKVPFWPPTVKGVRPFKFPSGK